jgi:hypothetical protein
VQFHETDAAASCTQLLLPLHGGGRSTRCGASPLSIRNGRHRSASAVAASFDFKQALRFEDEFDITIGCRDCRQDDHLSVRCCAAAANRQ